MNCLVTNISGIEEFLELSLHSLSNSSFLDELTP